MYDQKPWFPPISENDRQKFKINFVEEVTLDLVTCSGDSRIKASCEIMARYPKAHKILMASI
jgi:hypothetical protein